MRLSLQSLTATAEARRKKMARHLPLILKNCWRNKRRTVLTILSIGVSLCLLGVLMAIYHAFYFSDPPPESALRLVSRNKVSLAFPMPEFYRDKIKQVTGVREVAISQWFGGKYIDSRPEHMFARFAVEPDKIFTLREEIRIPDDQKKAFQQERTACIASRTLAQKFNWHLGDRITLMGDIFPVNLDLTLRGIFEDPREFDVLYFHRDYLEESLPLARRGNAGTFNILAKTTEDVPRIEKAVDEEFENSPVQTKTETESAFSLSFVAFLGNVKLFLLSVCAAVTFTILLVSANTIAMSVRERVAEVGVLKTLGYTRGLILGIILGEAVTISLVGGVLGLGLATVLVGLVRHSSVAFFQQLKTLAVVPSVAALCLLVAALVGLVSAFVPAYQSSRIAITEALRSTD
jgi:putative ABC transport system permease protein